MAIPAQQHSEQPPYKTDEEGAQEKSQLKRVINGRRRTTLADLFQSNSTSPSSSAPAVTPEDNLSVVHHRNPPSSSPAAIRSSELGSLKRSSSATKISNLVRNENTESYPSPSKSGPLLSSNPSLNPSESEHFPRNSSINSSNLKQSNRDSSAELSNGRFARSLLTNLEQSPSTNLRISEHIQRDLPTKSSSNERNQTKSGDFEHNLNSPSTKSIASKQHVRDPRAEKEFGAEQINGHVQGTPTKGKRLRKGFFSLLTDSGRPGKHSGSRESTRFTVEIPDKMLGLAWLDATPLLLSSGTYSFPTDGFMLERLVSETSSFVKHGSLHRVRIREGHLGVAWVDGKAVLLEAGVSIHSCSPARFSYIATNDEILSEKEFVLGPFRVVTVHDCEVGIKFCNRQPQILYPGRHCISISKVEVFAGFESLLRRQSNVSGASAMSSDNMRVSADVWVEWQIKPEDAAAARLANITDVEGALCDKVRRAFNLVMWEVNGQDMKLQLTAAGDAQNSLLQCNTTDKDPHPLMKTLCSDISRECMELFEEGWTVTLWDLQLSELVILSEVENIEKINAIELPSLFTETNLLPF